MSEYWPAFLALGAVGAVGWFLARLGRALREEDREEAAKVEEEEKAGRGERRAPVGAGRG